MSSLITEWRDHELHFHLPGGHAWNASWGALMFVTGLYIDGNRVTRVQINTHNHTCISQMIDSDFDVVSSRDRNGELFSVFVQDTGLINGLELNIVASVLSGHYLVGPAVVTGCTEAGETIGVTPSVTAHVREIIEAMGIHQAFSVQEEALS